MRDKEKHTKYTTLYQKEKLHTVAVRFQLWEWDIIHSYCNRRGYKPTTWIKSLIREAIASDDQPEQ